jgi:hypothetical protein
LRYKSREHACFEHTQQETQSIEALPILYCGMASQYNPPSAENARLPDARGESLQQEVTWGFEDNVADLLRPVNDFSPGHDNLFRT